MDFTQPWTREEDGTIKEIGIRLNPHHERMVLAPDGEKHRKAIWEAREKVAVKKKELAEREAIKSAQLPSDQLRRQAVPCKSCGGKAKERAALRREELRSSVGLPPVTRQ